MAEGCDGGKESLGGQILTVKVASAVGKPDAENQDSKENEGYKDGGHDAPHIQLRCKTSRVRARERLAWGLTAPRSRAMQTRPPSELTLPHPRSPASMCKGSDLTGVPYPF